MKDKLSEQCAALFVFLGLVSVVSAQIPLRSLGLPTKSPRGVGYDTVTWDSWSHTCLLTIATPAVLAGADYNDAPEAPTPRLSVTCPTNPHISRHEFAHELYRGRSHNHDCETAAGPWAPWIHPAYHVCYAIAVANITNMQPGDNVLDLGSGCGFKLQMWSEWLQINGVGVDYMHLHTRAANRLFQLNGAPLQGCTGSVQNLSWIPSQSMDIVHSHGVFMYLKQEWTQTCRILLDVYRILKHNGIFVILWQFRYLTSNEFRLCFKDVAGSKVFFLDERTVMSRGGATKKIYGVQKSRS